jgi:hypothetical protein
VLLVVPNFDRALDIFNVLGVTVDRHGLVNRLLVLGAVPLSPHSS